VIQYGGVDNGRRGDQGFAARHKQIAPSSSVVLTVPLVSRRTPTKKLLGTAIPFPAQYCGVFGLKGGESSGRRDPRHKDGAHPGSLMTASRLVSRSIKVHTRAPQGYRPHRWRTWNRDVEGYQDGRLLKEQMLLAGAAATN